MIDILLKLLMVVLTVALIVLIVGFCVWACDSWFPTHYYNFGVVVNKNFEEEHLQTTIMSTGKTCIPITNVIPDTWTFDIKYNNQVDSCEVSEKMYNTININDDVKIRYHIGRLSNALYVDDVYYMNN